MLIIIINYDVFEFYLCFLQARQIWQSLQVLLNLIIDALRQHMVRWPHRPTFVLELMRGFPSKIAYCLILIYFQVLARQEITSLFLTILIIYNVGIHLVILNSLRDFVS